MSVERRKRGKENWISDRMEAGTLKEETTGEAKYDQAHNLVRS